MENLPPHMLTPPPTDWGFNVFLDDLAENIKAEELERLKQFLSGEGGLGVRILENIKTPLQLFTILKQRRLVSRDNLTYLQGMLWHLKNKELSRKAVEYAKESGKALHFYAPSEQPENGYKFVKIHVDGRDFNKIQRCDLEQLRSNLSTLVMIPTQFIIFSGLEPSSSFTITIMIPEYYVSLLVEILSTTSVPELVELGIDVVYIDDKKYPLSCKKEIDVIQCKNEDIQVKTYKKLQIAEQQLQQSDIECLNYVKKLEEMKTELKEAQLKRQNIQELMSALYQLHVFQKSTLEYTQGSVPSLKIQSALVNLKFFLKKVKDLNYDSDVIMNLVQANSILVDSRVREGFISVVKSLMTDNQMLKVNIRHQQYTIQLLQFVSKRTPEEAQIYFISQLQNAFQLFAPQAGRAVTEVIVHDMILSHDIKLLQEYSCRLNKEDKQTLKKPYYWSQQENTLVENNPAVFLEMLVAKEHLRHGMPIILSTFLPPLLEHVGRRDLAMKFRVEIKALESEQARLSREASAQKLPTQGVPSTEQQQNQQLNEMQSTLTSIKEMVMELKMIKDERINLLPGPVNPLFGSKLGSLKEHIKSEPAEQFYSIH